MTQSEVRSINGREISDNYSRNQLLNKIDKNKINDDGTSKDELWSASKVNAQFNTITYQKANQSDLEIEKTRIDNLATLKEGSTTGDAELVDARVGIDGKIYNNLGSAIRNQVTETTKQINESIGNYKDVVWNDSGFININTKMGSVTPSSSWKYTNLIDVYSGSIIEFTTYIGGVAGGCFYDKNGVCIKKIKNTNESHKLIKFTVSVPEEAVKFAYSCEKSVSTNGHDFIKIIGLMDYIMSKKEVNDKFVEKFIHTSYQAKNGYFSTETKTIVDTELFKCKIIKVDPTKDRYIKYVYNIEASSTPTKVILFLNENGEIVGDSNSYTIPNYQEGVIYIPSDAVQCVLTMRTGNNTFKFSVLRKNATNNFETVKDMISSSATGESRVGGYIFRNNVEDPKIIEQTQEAQPMPYYDVNKSTEQYDSINCIETNIQRNILNNLPQEEIDFSPTDKGFIRIIVGKSDDDAFFVSYQASNYNGTFGNPKYNSLEITRDFKSFKTIWKSTELSDVNDSIAYVIGLTNVKVKTVKQFANGNYLIGASCKYADNTNATAYFLMTSDMSTITSLKTIDFDGNLVDLKDEFGGNIYDWHVDIKGTKAIVTTYGSRNPQNDYGRVWYTEDNGCNWKQVFRMTNHYNDGVDVADPVVTLTHIHGVMLDTYSNRMFVIAGEDNQNIFYSDKGLDTTDSTWQVIKIRRQLQFDFTDYTQVVNGYAFKNSLIFGSDQFGVGAMFRINKLDGGKYSELEIAHEFLPNIKMNVTSYCTADMYRRDLKTPLFICQTRENCAETEPLNEKLNQMHKGRVVVTYDGVNFTEVWSDNTYGEHDVFINGSIVKRNCSHCTRGMCCYLLKNGDVVIKYSGRDVYYFGGTPIYSEVGSANGTSKVLIIKNAERYL